jgi:phosphate transport system substrate-binding protein
LTRAGRALAVALFGATLFGPACARADTKITASGSTALLPLVKASAATFQEMNPDVKIDVAAGGSGTGINQVASRAVDIGNSDIPAKSHPELVDHRVAVVGFAVIANPGVALRELTKQQIREIFSGKLTNWKEVGGADEKITVINRPRSSGTRAVFVKTVMGGMPVAETGLTEDATGTVVATVGNTPGAVSYAALSGTRGKHVTALSIDGIAPTYENIVRGKYPVWSYEHMFTNGEPSADIKKFIDYVMENTEALNKLGFIQVKSMKVSETDR